MAATRLIALHARKGQSVSSSLNDRTDYAKNPEKTEKGELVTAYCCDPMTADEEFMLQKRLYAQKTGRARNSDVIAYQIRQSFKPGEITPEDANKLGQELALRFTKGKYSFIVATHTDRAHIHNHIVFNSTAMDGSRKFRNFYFSGLALQKISDLVCMEHNLCLHGTQPMTQINDQLGEINSELDKISTFQDKEYQSKVYALVAEVQKCSQFQIETVENEELRKRELDHLKDLEHECAQLLGQANLTLKEFEKKKDLDYSSYEKLVAEAQTWYQYQQILLEVMLKIEEMTYALNLGKVSKENCYSMFMPYSKQADGALKALESWHKEIGLALEIDLDASRRRRQGLEGFFMNIPALFNDDLHYRDVSKRTVSMITGQRTGQHTATGHNDTDLFQEDVRLIAKDGKLYYLPEVNHG